MTTSAQVQTPRTDEVTLGEWEYGRDEDGNYRVAALDYEVLRDRARELERELAGRNEELDSVYRRYKAVVTGTRGSTPDPNPLTDKYKLQYNKITKKIDKVRQFDGLAVESFDPPEECL